RRGPNTPPPGGAPWVLVPAGPAVDIAVETLGAQPRVRDDRERPAHRIDGDPDDPVVEDHSAVRRGAHPDGRSGGFTGPVPLGGTAELRPAEPRDGAGFDQDAA